MWKKIIELPKLCYQPGWRLMGTGYRTCFQTLCNEKIHIYMEENNGLLSDSL